MTARQGLADRRRTACNRPAVAVEHAGQPGRRQSRRAQRRPHRTARGRLGDHRPRRIRSRVPKRAGLVRQRQAPGDVDDVLADALVALAVRAEPQDRPAARSAETIVEAVRQLELERAPVADVHERVDARQVVAFPHAAQQRLRGRTRLGGIEADAAVHGAHRLALLGRMRPHGGLGRRPAAHPVARRPRCWRAAR